MKPLYLLAVLAAWGAACGAPDLEGLMFRCETHADCGQGYVCEKQLQTKSCVKAYENVNGVFDDKLVFGMSTALNAEVSIIADIAKAGTEGLRACFDKVNKQGGVHGRQLELKVMDDKYDPAITTQNVSQMLDDSQGNREVFALLAVFGTDNALAAREIVNKKKVLFFAPATGYDGLEPDPPDRYVFNVRARYSEEAEQLTSYALDELRIPAENFAVFGQGKDDSGVGVESLDGFGESGFEGVKKALAGQVQKEEDILVTSYKIKTTDVHKSIKEILYWMIKPERKVSQDGNIYIGITMAALPDAAATYIATLESFMILFNGKFGLPEETMKEYDLTLSFEDKEILSKVKVQFLSLSPVGSILPMALGLPTTPRNPLYPDKYLGVGTIVAMPTPDVNSNSTGVIEYREQLKKYNPEAVPDSISLEGYISAQLFVEGLKKQGRDMTTESLIETFETLNVDLGIGMTLSYSQNSHQAIKKLWAAKINDQLEYEPLGVLMNQK